MSTRILILKDGVIKPASSSDDLGIGGSSLTLGVTSTTAFRGDFGATAHNHSLIVSGNPHNVTKASVSLSNVDNIADTDKPVSIATQAAINLKANLASPTFTGNLAIPSTAGTSIGTVWRNVNNLEYKDSLNATQILLNSAGNLVNLSNKQTALNTLSGTQVANRVLRSDGTNITLSQVSLTTDVINVLPGTLGGTGQSSYTIGDILFASTSTALSKLVNVATGNVLLSGGVGVAPSYGKVGLTTHISGVLPISNGGTGSATQNFVDLTSDQNISGIKTFTASRIRLQSTFPGVWLDETDSPTKGAYIVLDGGNLQIQRRATAFGGFEASLFEMSIITGNTALTGIVTLSNTTASTSTTTGALVVSGGVAVGGFTTLGDNTAVKTKLLTGTTAATQGGVSSAAHGLTHTKIRGVQVVIEASNSFSLGAGYAAELNYQVDWFLSSTNFSLFNVPNNSSLILSKPFSVLLTYIA